MTIYEIEQEVTNFHNTYENNAKKYGYKTRKDTKKLDLDSPNGRTMIATVFEILHPYTEKIEKLEEEPEELFDNDKLQKKYNNLLKEQIKLKKQLQQKENIIKEVREYINNMKPLTIVETSIKEELKSAYNPKKSAIKGTNEYFNAVCHLEDFEIAIWNIKDILDKENK